MRWDAGKYEGQHSFVWKFGTDLLPLLDPKPDDRVLDIGCGTGQLTSKIAEAGAEVVGLDSSPEMIGQARQNHPAIRFVLADAARFHFDDPFDAIFSNAALHWVRDAESAVQSISAALKPGGRFVAEFGGKGNVAAVLQAASEILGRDVNPWYFPSVGEYSILLERHGFEVRYAALYDRPTELEDPKRGLRDWLDMFGGSELQKIAGQLEPAVRGRLFKDGKWVMDYRRLCVKAIKVA